jgi:methylmalonyl-CoA mutase N-terminal domain/subunit
MREAGCTAAQEIAFTLSNGKSYLRAAIDRGLDINVFSKRISFFFNAHNDLFEEIAKFRAARRMWAKITLELGASDARAQMLRFHSQTGGSTLTAQQPINNIVRVTVQALAAVLGGTQSLHTNGFDEALSLPTAEAATIAVRTQQILANESGVTQTVDPLGGSFYIEYLTDELEKSANNYIEKIDAMGGSVAAIESGYIQEEIARAAYRTQQKMEDGEQVVVGVNTFIQDGEISEKTFQVDDSIREMQIGKIKILKSERNNENVSASLQQLEQTILTRENVMPDVIHAVEQYATLGEIADVFRKIYGEYKA